MTKGVGRKIFRGGPIRMEPVLTTKNGRIFEIWELFERVCENPGGAMAPPCPPLPTPMVMTELVQLKQTTDGGLGTVLPAAGRFFFEKNNYFKSI